MSEPLPERPTQQPPAEPAPLFYESGAGWYWVLAGPAVGMAMLWIQHSSGYGWQPLMPTVFLVVVSGFLGLQVKAARVHTSVELTEHTLRHGTETIPVDDIVLVYPEPERLSRRAEKPEKWQSARALGELTGVPRGRVGIGLRLTGSRDAQAWARNHRGLRTALTQLVQQRGGRQLPGPDLGEDDDTSGSPW